MFDQMHQRMQTSLGKKMMTIRKSTVEPIIGTLVEYLGMKKFYTKGVKLFKKCMLMARMCYNLKKLLKHTFNNNIRKINGNENPIIYIRLMLRILLITN
ncbi:transposase [Pedobacter sp. PF22-3]|uniref:transposase n=1 Tax=Pedobacter sp. PF22-3 TaxID=2994467 RepID=UPI003A4D486D